jgi:hypothetical protein
LDIYYLYFLNIQRAVAKKKRLIGDDEEIRRIKTNLSEQLSLSFNIFFFPIVDVTRTTSCSKSFLDDPHPNLIS